MRPPSLRTLARQLGISAATVSLALRDSARVMPSTKKRVLQAARRAGYEANPLVGSLMAALRRTSHAGFQGSLIAVNVSADPTPELTLYHRQLYNGAERRARELGYSLELCWVGPHALSLSRLDAVLRARNVPGVVVMPFAESEDFSALNWARVAAVMLDHCLTAPMLHTVLPDHHSSLIDALGRLWQRGYRRPGLVLVRSKDARVKHRWTAGFGSFWQGKQTAPPVPVLIEEPLTPATFRRWFERHRPDVILGHLQNEIAEWLRGSGVSIPRHVGFVQLNWTERTAPCAGLDLHPMLIGAAAVESVVAQLQRNEHGVPAHPKTITLAGRWVDGPTLRSAVATAADRRRRITA